MSVYSLVHTIWTVALTLIFVGIAIWAYNGRQKSRFDEAARLPLTDDIVDSRSETPRHG